MMPTACMTKCITRSRRRKNNILLCDFLRFNVWHECASAYARRTRPLYNYSLSLNEQSLILYRLLFEANA